MALVRRDNRWPLELGHVKQVPQALSARPSVRDPWKNVLNSPKEFQESWLQKAEVARGVWVCDRLLIGVVCVVDPFSCSVCGNLLMRL